MLRSIATNSGWWLTERLTAIGLAIATSIALTRSLGPQGYGELSYLLALVGLLAPLTQFGLSGLVTRALLEKPDEERAVLGTALQLRIVGGLVALGIGAVYAAWGESTDTRRVLLVLLLAVQPAAMYQALEFWFQAQLRAGALVPWRLAVSVASAALKIGVAVATQSTAAVAVVFAVETLAAACACAVAYGRATHRWVWPRATPRWLGWYGRRAPWLLLSGIAEIIYLRIDIVMLERIRGLTETGIYAVAARVSEIWYGVPVLIAASAFPALWARRLEGAAYARALQAAFDLLCWLAVALALAMQWGAGPLVIGLFGARYAPAAPILTLHIWAAVFVFMRAVFSRWLLVEDLVPYSLVTHASGAALNVALNLVLIPRYGGQGAAVATVASYATASWGALFLARRTRPIGIMMTKSLLLPLRWADLRAYAHRLGPGSGTAGGR